MTQTAASLLVRCLEINGFRRAFGVPGESYLDLLDALRDSAIDYITCRHEGGAAMAACAHGQLTGLPGLCMVTRGPGATNASAGLHAARQGGVPMLLLIGQVPRTERHRNSFQEIEYGRALSGELTKWVAEIHDAARIPEYIARAVRTARAGNPGPVALVLPEDLLADLVEGAPVAAAEPTGARLPGECAEAIGEELARAERPFLILGGSGWNEEAADAVGSFARANQVPVGFSFRAQDCLDNEHECVAGPFGIGGDPELGQRLRDAELVILNGARVGDDTGSLDAALGGRDSNPRLVHLHPDAEEPGRVLPPQVAAVVAPARAALGLAELRTPVPDARRRWREAWRAAYVAASTPRKHPHWYLSQVVGVLQEMLPPDAVICNGAGNAAVWIHRYYRYRQPGTALAPVSGSMGYDLPAALAAALERPAAPVIAWAGDGSFQMTCQELATAAQTGAKLTVIVVDNGMLATIRMHQERRFPGRVSGTDIASPDFAGLARSLGAFAARADDLAAFRKALGQCLASDGPSLIHLPVDPKVLAPGVVLDG